MAKIREVDQSLDETLPDSIRSAASVLNPAVSPDNQPAQQSAQQPNEENIMNGPNAQATVTNLLTPEQIQAVASQAVSQITQAKDRDQAIASVVEKHLSEANTARATAADLQSKLAAAEQALAAEKAAHEQVSTAHAAFKKKVDDEEADEKKPKFNKKAKADFDEISGKLATASKQLADLQAEKIIAARTQAIAATKLTLENFSKRAVARTEEGGFAMDEATFTETLADYVANAPKAQATPADPATPAAPAAPADPATPAPATPAATPAAPATQATASEAAPPDLTAVGMYSQATAALVNGGPQPSQQGKAAFAAAFGIDSK